MKKIFFLSIIQICSVLHGQEKYSYEFEKLPVTDTIYNNETIASLQSDSEYKYDDYFVARRDFEGEINRTIYCLLKKVKYYWISYAIPYEYCTACSTNPIGLSENKKYFLATSRYNHLSHGAGHGNENTIQKLILVDIAHVSAIQIESDTEDIFWETKENGDETSGKDIMVSNHILENNQLTILNTCFDDQKIKDCANAGGLYEFKDNKLLKIMNYNPLTKGFTKIRYAGGIAIGMTLEDVRLAYPNARFFENENAYGTCTDSKIGFELWDADQLLGYALTIPVKQNTDDETNSGNTNYNNEKIYRFIVSSPKINFGKINSNSTAAEVLKLYPKANVRLDLLSDWEHIYIQELHIELVFKTDDNNRIGIYKNETFTSLRNKKAKADFIVVN